MSADPSPPHPPELADAELTYTDDLAPDQAAAVEALLARAETADHTAALNEAGLLALRHRRPGLAHLRRIVDGELRGYAQLTETDDVSTGQLVVDPAARRAGHGTALVAQLRHRARHPLQLWALGDTAAAQALAHRSGLVGVRTLLIMTRALAEVPAAQIPAGARIDTFSPGEDETAWLEVNRRAFAAHPEQGTVTAQDLAERMAEPWFDPRGFFLAHAASAEQSRSDQPLSTPPLPTQPRGRLLGFHWTKQHPGRLGEVYVIGVDPDAQGAGLATALLLTGLAYLRDRGNTEVELYVEADSTRAVALYARHGFDVAGRDVMYAVRPSD